MPPAELATPPASRSLRDGLRLWDDLPQTAAFYAGVAAVWGADYVKGCLRAAIALRAALDADDYAATRALYRDARAAGVTPAHAVEAGWQLGASDDEVRAFARRHRAAQRMAA